MKDELVCLNTTNPSSRLILLHGWGADAEDLIPFGQMIQERLQENIEVISLNAPDGHPQGVGRQWYGLFPADWTRVPGVVKSLKIRLECIATKEIPLERTAILGFSQGGAMALSTGSELPVAGIIACSAYPHPSWVIPSEMPPVLLTHGKQDEVVPLSAMEKIRKLLEEKDFEVNIQLFEGGHEIPEILVPNILESLHKWL